MNLKYNLLLANDMNERWCFVFQNNLSIKYSKREEINQQCLSNLESECGAAKAVELSIDN